MGDEIIYSARDGEMTARKYRELEENSGDYMILERREFEKICKKYSEGILLSKIEYFLLMTKLTAPHRLKFIL